MKKLSAKEIELKVNSDRRFILQHCMVNNLFKVSFWYTPDSVAHNMQEVKQTIVKSIDIDKAYNLCFKLSKVWLKNNDIAYFFN